MTLCVRQNNTDFAWGRNTLKCIAEIAEIWNTDISLSLQNFYLPLGISLVMLQLIFVQGLWLTRKWLHVLLWDIPQKMQGRTRLFSSEFNTSCLCCEMCAWAVTENNFCAVTFCNVVHALFVKLRKTLKMVLTGSCFSSTGLYLSCVYIISLFCAIFEISIWWLLGCL